MFARKGVWAVLVCGLVGLALFFVLRPNGRTPKNNAENVASRSDSLERDEETLAPLLYVVQADELVGVDSSASEPIELAIDGLVEVNRPDGHDHRLGIWQGRLRPHPSRWNIGSEPMLFRLELPDGEMNSMRIDHVERVGETHVLFAGTIVGSEHSRVIFSLVNEALSGVVRLPNSGVSWELRHKGDRLLEWEKVDLNKLEKCGLCEASL
jgi:hypothetical protein